MIELITVRAPEKPGIISAVLAALTDIFGAEEGELERRQLSGAEAADNEDVLFTAWEDGRLLSTIHLTVSRAHPGFGCLGGLVTLPAARGKGLAGRLFGQACSYYDELGGGTLFLGTSNPMAARLYSKFGFSFITGTNIMVRTSAGSLFDFYRDAYAPGQITYGPAGDFCRVPIVPLAAARGRDMLMDTNIGLISTDYVTQVSCTGLYPRLLRVMARGGVWCAALPTGALCALCTVQEQEDGASLDAFAYPGFEHTLPQLMEMACAGYRNLIARIADCDREKKALFASLGFEEKGPCLFTCRGLQIPCTLMTRE